MMRRLALAAVLLLWPAAAGAHAQHPVCSPRADALAHLAKKYGETPAAAGMTNDGFMVELLRTPDGATWTILTTSPQGKSCIRAAGQGWRRLNPPGPNLDPRT